MLCLPGHSVSLMRDEEMFAEPSWTPCVDMSFCACAVSSHKEYALRKSTGRSHSVTFSSHCDAYRLFKYIPHIGYDSVISNSA